MGLVRGDRLELSPELSNVADFEKLRPPCRVSFWRAAKDTLSRRRNPLFNARTGLDNTRLGIDVLHALSLGVYQVFLMELFWDLIVHNVFVVAGPMSTRAELSVNRIKEMLFGWYAKEDRAGRSHPRVNQFLPGTLGTFSDRHFRVHAAATNGLLIFAEMLCNQSFAARMGAKLGHWKQGLAALLRIQRSIDEHPRRFPDQAVQGFVDDVLDHCSALDALQIGCKPKHHMMGELASRLSEVLTGMLGTEAHVERRGFRHLSFAKKKQQAVVLGQPVLDGLLGRRGSQPRTQAGVPRCVLLALAPASSGLLAVAVCRPAKTTQRTLRTVRKKHVWCVCVCVCVTMYECACFFCVFVFVVRRGSGHLALGGPRDQDPRGRRSAAFQTPGGVGLGGGGRPTIRWAWKELPKNETAILNSGHRQ